MISKEECTTKRSRINFLDNLRSIIILLVILYHAGGVYESSGIWASFWIVDDPATNNFVGILNVSSQNLGETRLPKTQIWPM